MDIKKKLSEIGLTPGNSVVIGSGILNALGLRESHDIDLIVTEEKYKEFSSNDRFTRTENHGQEVLADDLLEIGMSWTVIGKTWGLEDLIDHSIVIDGVRYNRIEFLLDAKRKWLNDGDARQKDIDDIKLMEDYLGAHKIFIYGVPGSGKTYTSQKISRDLGLPLFEADTLKDELRKDTTKEDSPFLFLGTCQAYRHFGELNVENAIMGLKSVRQALSDRVSKEIQSYDEVVMEGAFLDPNLLKDIGRISLIITSNEEQHENQFFTHRDINPDNIEEFKAARIIQDFLVKEARGLGVEVVENISS